ncbi:MAG: helix-turn-helix domain-containing protein [Rhodospirillales bacterium]|nr:helix-turn-helix domain-containing protein [Rhodospirillales bacterium]
MLTIADVADHCSVSVKTVRRWIAAGDLVAHRLGQQLRISEVDLGAFLALRRQVVWPQLDGLS